MKTRRTPTLAFSFLYLVFLGCLVLTAGSLPERVATHFDLGGQPNGWMDRSTHLAFIAGFGLVLPLVIVVVCFALRFAPDSSINIPHRECWLAPERRAETISFVFRHSLWLACGTVAFVTGVHLLIVQANRQIPAQLPLAPILAWAGCLIVGIAVWAGLMLRHFKRPPGSRQLPGQKA
jgi:uncharacterized membrane protein